MPCSIPPWIHSWNYEIVECIREEDASSGKISRYIVRRCLCTAWQYWTDDKWRQWSPAVCGAIPSDGPHIMEYLARIIRFSPELEKKTNGILVKDGAEILFFEGTDDKFLVKKDENVICRVVRDVLNAGLSSYQRYRVYTYSITPDGIEETENLATFSILKVARYIKTALEEISIKHKTS